MMCPWSFGTKEKNSINPHISTHKNDSEAGKGMMEMVVVGMWVVNVKESGGKKRREDFMLLSWL